MDGVIEIGRENYFNGHLGPPYHHYPLQDKLDLYATTIHEIGHGLFHHQRNGKGSFDTQLWQFGGENARHVNDVLETHLPGSDLRSIPLKPRDGRHIDLQGSLMSHQNYRNYRWFMEAELALLQDVGWLIDRRNFFGYSLYRNGQTMTNLNGYFSRNERVRLISFIRIMRSLMV